MHGRTGPMPPQGPTEQAGAGTVRTIGDAGAAGVRKAALGLPTCVTHTETVDAPTVAAFTRTLATFLTRSCPAAAELRGFGGTRRRTIPARFTDGTAAGRHRTLLASLATRAAELGACAPEARVVAGAAASAPSTRDEPTAIRDRVAAILEAARLSVGLAPADACRSPAAADLIEGGATGVVARTGTIDLTDLPRLPTGRAALGDSDDAPAGGGVADKAVRTARSTAAGAARDRLAAGVDDGRALASTGLGGGLRLAAGALALALALALAVVLFGGGVWSVAKD
jgi:hypothetical protein